MTTPQLSIAVSDCSKTKLSIGRVYQMPGSSYRPKIRYKEAAEGIKANKLFPSITNIISQKALDLSGWHLHMMNNYIMHNIHRYNGENLFDILRPAKSASKDYTQAACDKGTEVHTALEEYVLTGRTQSNFEHGGAGYYQAGLQFIEDFKPEFIKVEATVYGKTRENGGYYAGTIDGIIRIGDKVYAIDWKTSKTLHVEVALQLAAGIKGTIMANDTQTGTTPMIHIDGALGIHLTENGYSVEKVNDIEAAWDTFKALREVYDWAAFDGGKVSPVLTKVETPEGLK